MPKNSVSHNDRETGRITLRPKGQPGTLNRSWNASVS